MMPLITTNVSKQYLSAHAISSCMICSFQYTSNRVIWYDVIHITVVTGAEYECAFQTIKYNSYPALAAELWCVFCGDLDKIDNVVRPPHVKGQLWLQLFDIPCKIQQHWLQSFILTQWSQPTTEFNNTLNVFSNTVNCYVLAWFCQSFIVLAVVRYNQVSLVFWAALTMIDNRIDPITRAKYPAAPSLKDKISIKY